MGLLLRKLSRDASTMADESSSDLSLHEEHLGKPCDLCGESCEANQELCVPLRAMHGPAPLTPAQEPVGLLLPGLSAAGVLLPPGLPRTLPEVDPL